MVYPPIPHDSPVQSGSLSSTAAPNHLKLCALQYTAYSCNPYRQSVLQL